MGIFDSLPYLNYVKAQNFKRRLIITNVFILWMKTVSAQKLQVIGRQQNSGVLTSNWVLFSLWLSEDVFLKS